MTALAMPLGLIAPHPGRRARPGPVRQAVTAVNLTAAVVAAGIIAGGWMLAAHPQLPRTRALCVPYHTCACRYPGAPGHLRGNQLCVVLWHKPADVAGGQP